MKNSESTTAKGKGKDLAAFRAAHDRAFIIPDKIRRGLTALGDSWEYEVDFIKRCGCSTTDFAAYREQFKDFYVETPRCAGGSRGKRVWAGTKAFTKKLQEALT